MNSSFCFEMETAEFSCLKGKRELSEKRQRKFCMSGRETHSLQYEGPKRRLE